MKFVQIAARSILFLVVNVLVMATITFILMVLHVPQRIGGMGNFYSLLFFCGFFGMLSSFVSLLLSRWMAKMFHGVQVIDPNTSDPNLRWLVQTVYRLARAEGLSAMPEVGVYNSPEINAFATGPTHSQALVAVSAGLLNRMRPDEIEGVLGHEITHIANGDMVTMTLIQGVVNTLAMLLSYIAAIALSQSSSRDERGNRGGGNWFMQYMLQQVFQSVFMLLGYLVVAKFSRWREFRADAGGARYAGREKMLAALRKLKLAHESGVDQMGKASPSLQALQISGKTGGFMALLADHPPIEERIARLERASLG